METLKKITILLFVLSFLSCESKRKKEADEIVLNEMVIEKNSGESNFRKAVREGMPPSEAFAKFGVL